MPDTHLETSLLGKPTEYSHLHGAEVLYAIPRAPMRAALGISGTLPFLGADIWNAYELSWLNLRGKPQVALAKIIFPADSPALIESKSLKLYLNGYSQTAMQDMNAVKNRIAADLSQVAGARVDVHLQTPEEVDGQRLTEMTGLLLDRLDIDVEVGPVGKEILQVDAGAPQVEQTLVSRLLKSNCPVTGQPDWASIQIYYLGAPIDQSTLLRYLVGFRTHNAFHEQCVEQIFVDIQNVCRPTKLSVYARYTRRGGLDINPWRSNFNATTLPSNSRHPRQ
jgi:7-cyano-7-deazaguanine reductase